MVRSRIKNGYSKWPSRENFLELKKAKRLCKNLFSSKDIRANQQFWDKVKPFFSNKNLHSNDHILINNKNDIIDNKVKLVELFIICFINVVENTTGKAPTSPWDSSNQ